MIRSVCFCLLIVLSSIKGFAQSVTLSAFKKVNVGNSEIDLITFSQDSKYVIVSDSKGKLQVFELETGKLIKADQTSGKNTLIEYLVRDKALLVVKANGTAFTLPIADGQKQNISINFSNPVTAVIDPSQTYLTAINKEGQIETFDLVASMTHNRMASNINGKNILFLGYDRFGQQLIGLNNLGDCYNWEFLSQKLIRQLKLQSEEFSGSKSVVKTASLSKGSDLFLVAFQEIFIPKGGLRPGGQPERRNSIGTFDLTSGNENKRIQVQFRPDGFSAGAGANHLFYFSSDSRTIFSVDIDKGEVTEPISVDERPSAIASSKDGEWLAIGTTEGKVSIFEVIKNNPAEISITNPPVSRGYGETLIQDVNSIVEGRIAGLDKVNTVFVNDAKAAINPDGTFSAKIDLAPGKNRVRVVAQNAKSQVVTKDIYLTSQPSNKSTTSRPVTHGQKRIALVIGNADYQFSSKLRNTINDVKSMEATLKSLDFEVILVQNGSYETMKNAIFSFGDKIEDADVSLFFYAGHGLEVDGANYLVPVDASIQSHLDIKQKCIPLGGVTNTMEFANEEGLNMIILDACRNNPFPSGKRGGEGLARVNAPSGTLIAYATDPGSVASDGDGVNGLYTGELVKQLKISQRIEDVFMNTRNSVEKLSGGNQRPWEEARLKGVFFLK